MILWGCCTRPDPFYGNCGCVSQNMRSKTEKIRMGLQCGLRLCFYDRRRVMQKKKRRIGVLLMACMLAAQPMQAAAATIIIPVNPDGSTAETQGEGTAAETAAPGTDGGVIYAPSTGETRSQGPGVSETPQESLPAAPDGAVPGGEQAELVNPEGQTKDSSVHPAGLSDQTLLPEGDGAAAADSILGTRAFVITQLVNTDGVVDVYTMKTTVDDDQWNTVGDGFSGMKAHMEEGVGSVYYRVYTDATGWTDWALNDTKTQDTGGAKVTAFQMRLQGYTGNLYNMWYKAQLSDGTETGWTTNGTTCGTIGTGKYITAIQCRFWKKDVRFPLSAENYFIGAQYEGMVQAADGTLRYQKADGTAYTGWAYVGNDKYYIRDNVPLTGWNYLDGYKFYFDESGKLVTDLEPLLGNPHDFKIRVNRARNSFTVYTKDGENGYIIPYKVFLTTLNATETPLGTYKFYAKYRWKYMHDDPSGRGIYCQYLNRFYNGFIVHSLIYKDKADSHHFDADSYNRLGAQSSDGCVRLRADQAKWVYENCPNGTEITIYDDAGNIGPLDRPAVEQAIPLSQDYDPTDDKA